MKTAPSLAALTALLATGCPSSPEPIDASTTADVPIAVDGSPDDGGTAADEAAWRAHAEAVAEAVCALDARCGTAFSHPSAGTLGDCDESVEAALSAPPSFVGARFDATRAAACLGALEGSCLDLAVAYARDLLPLECIGVVHGDAPDGASCTNSECGEPRGLCSIDGICPAVCTVLGDDGDACAYSLGCAEGLYCLRTGTGSDRTCRALGAAGAACSSSEECEVGAHCAFTSDDWTVPGTCTAGALAAGDRCEPDLGCGTASLACVATREGPEVMGSRGPVYTCETPRTDGSCRAGSGDCGRSRCDASIFTAPYEGSCVAELAAGGDCSGAIDPPRCGAGLRCVAGTCTAVARLGEACTADAQCTTGSCDGTCVVIEAAPVCP